MNDEDDHIIRCILPEPALPPDEVHSWGLILWRNMTREEFEAKYPRARQKEAKE